MRVSLSLLAALILTFTGRAFAVMAVPEGAVPITSSPSINPAAQQGKSSQDSGSMMNMMMGVAMMAMCMATQPPNMPMCMMGAMAMAQGGADKDAASQSGATQMASSTTGATGTNASSGNGANVASVPTYAAIDDTSASLKDKAAAKAGLSALTNAGYKASAAGITSANGTTIPPSAFNSSGSMAAAGLDPDQSKAAQAAAAKLSSDLSKYKGQAAVAEGVGGGGGSGPTGESSSSPSDPRKPNFVNPFAMTDQAKTALVAGKTVSFDGEPIGVKGDNIFDMVHGAYVRKTAGKHFIETDHDPDLNAVRAPASLPKMPPRK